MTTHYVDSDSVRYYQITIFTAPIYYRKTKLHNQLGILCNFLYDLNKKKLKVRAKSYVLESTCKSRVGVLLIAKSIIKLSNAISY
jgi:hypothetical protein